ncbi:hypothetical protein ABK040_002655 [Willaertia magna]
MATVQQKPTGSSSNSNINNFKEDLISSNSFNDNNIFVSNEKRDSFINNEKTTSNKRRYFDDLLFGPSEEKLNTEVSTIMGINAIPRKWKTALRYQIGLIVFVVAVEYALVVMNNWIKEGMYSGLWVLLLCFCSVMTNNSFLSLPFLHENPFKATLMLFQWDRLKLLINLLLFSLRFFSSTNKIILLPVCLFSISGAPRNATKIFWNIFPIYYISGHYLVFLLYKCCLLTFSVYSNNTFITTDHCIVIQKGEYHLPISDYNIGDWSALILNIVNNYYPCFVIILLFGFTTISLNIHLATEYQKATETTNQLKEALEAKNRFVSHISHEFRSPLLSTLGSVELLKETKLSKEQNEHVETIESSNNILLSLIEDILLFSKLEHERSLHIYYGKNFEGDKTTKEYFENKIQTFNLDQSLRLMHSIIKNYASRFKVNVVVDIEEKACSLVVKANYVRLQQLIMNLLTNAVKASHENSNVELYCKVVDSSFYRRYSTDSTISVDSTGDRPSGQENSDDIEYIQFDIVDYGIGIPKSKQKQIFEPFAQLHNLNESVSPGSGLGLCTVLNIVKSMNGVLELQSEVNQGSTFTVVLPLHVVKQMTVSDDGVEKQIDEEETSSIPVNTEHTEQSTIMLDNSVKRQIQIQENYIGQMLKQKEEALNEEFVQKPQQSNQIIVAEDNAINRKVLLKILKNLGYEADAVCDGQQLLDNINPNNHKVVITDMHMPNVNGLTASKEIKNKYGDKIKIIMLTADAMCNFDQYTDVVDIVMCKPCSKIALQENIAKLLS